MKFKVLWKSVQWEPRTGRQEKAESSVNLTSVWGTYNLRWGRRVSLCQTWWYETSLSQHCFLLLLLLSQRQSSCLEFCLPHHQRLIQVLRALACDIMRFTASLPIWLKASEDSHFHRHRCENFKSQLIYFIPFFLPFFISFFLNSPLYFPSKSSFTFVFLSSSCVFLSCFSL
jgi:hypothetical protein